MAGINMNKALSEQQFVQYYRQILLPEVGEKGQQTLMSQHIMIVGIGGLGTHVAQQLAAAGIGHLHLVDDDKVDMSNLPRQILFNASSVGREKVECAAKEISKLNPDVTVRTYREKFSEQFAQSLFSRHSDLKQACQHNKLMVLDCSDNMPTRQLINAWCARQLIPLVSASVTAFSGQLMVVDAQRMPEAGCYHCVFSAKETLQTCSDMGVLGPMVSVIASMQALTAIRHVLTIGDKGNTLHIFDGLRLIWQNIVRHRDPQCTVCQHWQITPQEPLLSETNSFAQEAYL
jgi:sulfur carrier protein ThiS adenylyltransferase